MKKRTSTYSLPVRIFTLLMAILLALGSVSLVAVLIADIFI